MGTAPATGAEVPVRPGLLRGRLFRKYLMLIISLVSVALLASGGIGLYFSYQEHRSALASLQREKAVAAASRIEQYLRQVSQQLTYAALPQIDAADVELRRIEFLKLLRQAPEVTDIAQLDGSGREQLAVSRLGMDVVASGKDRSGLPAGQTRAALVRAGLLSQGNRALHDGGHALRGAQQPGDGGRSQSEVHLGCRLTHPHR